jgi:glycosyltransferase involved in cell wall biosynthesis
VPAGQALTTVIPTRDEELHIERAVRSVTELGPVFVVDSGSSDETAGLAAAAGANVVEHAWEGYAAQKNWALASLPITTEWVLFIDADELVSAELRDEIRRSIARPDAPDGYYIPRRSLFLGRPLEHAGWYPDHQLRLFRRSAGRFEDRLVHEHLTVTGTTGFLECDLVHDNRKGMAHLVAKHRHYAELEAREMLARHDGAERDLRRGSFFGTWPERRRALKTRVWYRLPGRPAVRFVWLYVVKLGFLDGRRGYEYARLLTGYEVEINRALKRLRLERP